MCITSNTMFPSILLCRTLYVSKAFFQLEYTRYRISKDMNPFVKLGIKVNISFHSIKLLQVKTDCVEHRCFVQEMEGRTACNLNNMHS